MARLTALYALRDTAFEQTYGAAQRARIAELVDVVHPRPFDALTLRQRPELLARIEILVSGWGGPLLDGAFLRAAPNLRAVFYGAGSVSRLVTAAAWDRQLVVTTAQRANAVPVAEYALAMIVLSLKHVFPMSRQMRHLRRYPGTEAIPGCFQRIVGLVSLGATARALIERLAVLDVEIIAYDPFVSARDADRLGVTLVDLATLVETADVVSIHTPHLPETEEMITGAHLASMKPGAALINTARGALVREEALIRVAVSRPDLQFILDVTSVARRDAASTVLPPEPCSPLYDLPNVFLTPHIAGSIGDECQRMGQCMVEEIERYVAGRPLRWALTPERIVWSAHRPCQ